MYAKHCRKVFLSVDIPLQMLISGSVVVNTFALNAKDPWFEIGRNKNSVLRGHRLAYS